MKWLNRFWSDEEGQGITEYACVLAFTSCVIVTVFAVTQGTFADAIFTAYSTMASEINRLSDAAANGGPPAGP